MIIVKGHETEQAKSKLKGAIVAIGNFDGVHLGHQALLHMADRLAKARRSQIAVYTFDPHPTRFLKPGALLKLLTTEQQKLRLLKSFGVEVVCLEPFNAKFARMTPEAFAQVLLSLKIQAVVVGNNFTFGHMGVGNPALLKKLLEPQGVIVEVVSDVVIDGAVCSSSQIRNALTQGDVQKAAKMLGRYYSVDGTVVTGAGRGSSIGIPTANLKPDNELVPGNGVYSTLCRVRSGELYRAVTNIGVRPTFGDAVEPQIETHILDFSDHLYGECIELYFLQKIREEKKFASVNELVQQIYRDIAAVRDSSVTFYGA